MELLPEKVHKTRITDLDLSTTPLTNGCRICALASRHRCYTGWRRINRTIQTFNRVYESLHKLTLLILVSHRQIRRHKFLFKYSAVINTCGTTFESSYIFFTVHHCVCRSYELRKISLVFVQLGAKVNRSFYYDIVLNQCLLPDIQKLSDNNFTFQQDGALAHQSRQTVAFLRLQKNWPLNSPDLNYVDNLIYGSTTTACLL